MKLPFSSLALWIEENPFSYLLIICLLVFSGLFTVTAIELSANPVTIGWENFTQATASPEPGWVTITPEGVPVGEDGRPYGLEYPAPDARNLKGWKGASGGNLTVQ